MSELVKETVIVNKTAVETVSETTGEVEEMNELVRETTSETMVETEGKDGTAVGKKEDDDMYIEEWNKNLPKITGKEKNVILANVSDEFAINMQLIRNSGNMRSHGAILFLSNIKTNVAYIDDSDSLKVKKEKIINSNGDKVMSILDEFSIPVTIDTKKLAYKRAQEYLNKTTEATDVSSSMRIGEACKKIVEYAIEQAKKEMEREKQFIAEQAEDEQKKEIVKTEERRFFYDEVKQRVGIRVEYFQKVLDALETGYKKSTFGKNIRIEEARTGKEILISNRTGSGYAYNMTGNERYYMFNIKNVLG